MAPGWVWPLTVTLSVVSVVASTGWVTVKGITEGDVPGSVEVEVRVEEGPSDGVALIDGRADDCLSATVGDGIPGIDVDDCDAAFEQPAKIIVTMVRIAIDKHNFFIILINITRRLGLCYPPKVR